MTRKQKRAATRTQSQADAARANGARSQGPITPEGKARSAQNSLRHGAFSQTILLETESREQLETLVNDYIADYAPQNDSQIKIVYRLAAATWRQQRAEAVEAALINEKMHQQAPIFAQQPNPPEISPTLRTCLATSDLYSAEGRLKAVQNAVDLCQRQFSRALRDLERAKKMNTEPKDAQPTPELQNPEPEPQPTPTAEPQPGPQTQFAGLPLPETKKMTTEPGDAPTQPARPASIGPTNPGSSK